MSYEDQNKEIESIRERTIKVKLSDADCERLTNLCGRHNMIIGELLENFIGDLVGGTYSNGSDERMYANMWFRRCYFSWSADETLLRYMLDMWDVEDFLTLCDEIDHYKEHPEEYEDDIADAKACNEELLWFEREYNDYIEGYVQKHPEADMQKEIEAIRKWYSEKEQLLGNEEQGE